MSEIQFVGDIIRNSERAESRFVLIVHGTTQWALYEKNSEGRYVRIPRPASDFTFTDPERGLVALINCENVNICHLPEPEHGCPGSRGPPGFPGIPGTPGKNGTSGSPGIPGSTGSQGVRGAQGLRGEPGISGKRGLPGSDGKDGMPGLPGSPGLRGMRGHPGPSGSHGPSGKAGSSERGPPGLPGSPGLPGLPGSRGAPGLPGSNGKDGLRGPLGSPGRRGPSGPEGLSGSPGVSGISGPPGLSGISGEQGPSGISGPQGPSGISGNKGPSGNQGSDGAPGGTGSEGNPGSDGNPGLPGHPGTRGSPGSEGKTGLPGAPGAPGADGEIGLPGAPGDPGPQGAPGVGLPGAPGANGYGPPGNQGAQGAVGAPGLEGYVGPPGNQGIRGSQGSPGPRGDSVVGLPGPSGNKGVSSSPESAFSFVWTSSASSLPGASFPIFQDESVTFTDNTTQGIDFINGDDALTILTNGYYQARYIVNPGFYTAGTPEVMSFQLLQNKISIPGSRTFKNVLHSISPTPTIGMVGTAFTPGFDPDSTNSDILTISINPTIGSSIYVCAQMNYNDKSGNPDIYVTDNHGNTYSGAVTGSTNNLYTQISYFDNIQNSDLIVKITFNNALGNYAEVIEIVGTNPVNSVGTKVSTGAGKIALSNPASAKLTNSTIETLADFATIIPNQLGLISLNFQALSGYPTGITGVPPTTVLTSIPDPLTGIEAATGYGPINFSQNPDQILGFNVNYTGSNSDMQYALVGVSILPSPYLVEDIEELVGGAIFPAHNGDVIQLFNNHTGYVNLITPRQEPPTVVNLSFDNGSGTSFTVTVTPTPGNSLYVCLPIQVSNPGTFNVTDGGYNTYIPIENSLVAPVYTTIYYADNIKVSPSGSLTIQVIFYGEQAYGSMQVLEITGTDSTGSYVDTSFKDIHSPGPVYLSPETTPANLGLLSFIVSSSDFISVDPLLFTNIIFTATVIVNPSLRVTVGVAIIDLDKYNSFNVNLIDSATKPSINADFAAVSIAPGRYIAPPNTASLELNLIAPL